jgi:hypothetical protein
LQLPSDHLLIPFLGFNDNSAAKKNRWSKEQTNTFISPFHHFTISPFHHFTGQFSTPRQQHAFGPSQTFRAGFGFGCSTAQYATPRASLLDVSA